MTTFLTDALCITLPIALPILAFLIHHRLTIPKPRPHINRWIVFYCVVMFLLVSGACTGAIAFDEVKYVAMDCHLHDDVNCETVLAEAQLEVWLQSIMLPCITDDTCFTNKQYVCEFIHQQVWQFTEDSWTWLMRWAVYLLFVGLFSLPSWITYVFLRVYYLDSEKRKRKQKPPE